MTEGDYAFVRMHLDPATVDDDRRAVAGLEGRVRTIPSARAGRLYDDKVAQSRELVRWMPRTIVATTRDDALAAAETLGLPLMSKAAGGASSRNVRFIRTEAELRHDIGQCFGDGLVGQYGVRQQGYVLMQEFCHGNAHDFRVIAVGRERLILRRGNRDDAPMASGANKEMPITWPDAEASEVLAYADSLFAAEDFRFCGVDIVKGPDGWKIIEFTTSWPTKNNAAHTTVSGRNWGAFFDIILDEIEAGAFA